MKEKFPADSDFQECWVVFQTEYEAASQEKYPRPDLRLRIIIMIMHNGLKISANVIFERMKPLYPQFYNYKRSYYPTTPPGFFRKFDFRLRKIIWHNYIRYQYLELKTDEKSFLFLLLPGKLKTWLWPKSSDRRPVVRGERREERRSTTHLLAECRYCLTVSSSGRWWCGGRGPPRRTRSPGSWSSSPGPATSDRGYFVLLNSTFS